MDFHGQIILPAIKNMKDFEKILNSPYKYIVLLDSHIAQLQSIMKHATSHRKKLLLHADLVHGLKNDEYAAQFLCHNIKPAGLISTRASILQTAKKNGILAVQRLFLLDTIALETSYKLIEKVNPDVIEVLPGVVPPWITKIHNDTKIPIITGGLIRTKEEIDQVIAAGAIAVTTSRKELWE